MTRQLDHTPSQIVRQLLIDLGLGTDGGASWPIYAVEGANNPDNTLLVIDTTGIPRARFQVSGEEHELFGVMIVVRASTAQTAFLKAMDIKHQLATNVTLKSVTVSDSEDYGTGQTAYTVWNMSRSSGPIPAHPPDSDRKVYTLNYLVNVLTA